MNKPFVSVNPPLFLMEFEPCYNEIKKGSNPTFGSFENPGKYVEVI